MPSDNLLNCTVTQFGPSFEDVTDSHVLQNLNTQNPPEGADYVGPQHGVYYLVVSADPEYRIRASWININNENASLEYLQPIGTAFSEFGSGIYIYDAMLGATLPSEVVRVRIYDSLGANYNNCDNKVIVQVMLSEAFSMPANNVEIKINLNGGANLCPISGDGGSCEDCSYDCESANACGMGWNLWNFLIVTNSPYNASMTQTQNVPWVAAYIEDDYNSKTNPYNYHFQGYIDGTTITSPTNGAGSTNMYATNVFDPDDLSSNSCLGNSKPTCYAHSQVNMHYGDASAGFIGNAGDICCGDSMWLNPSTGYTPSFSTFGNIAGRLIFYPWIDTATNPYGFGIDNSFSIYQGSESMSPNLLTADNIQNAFGTTIFNNSNTIALVKAYRATRGQTYVDRHDYLNTYSIQPGDTNMVVPDKECWYVSLSVDDSVDESQYINSGDGGFPFLSLNLYADPLTIDVWGAITIVRKWGNVPYYDSEYDHIQDDQYPGSMNGWGIGTAASKPDTSKYIYYEWTPTDNQCDLDLDNKTIEQVNSKTVKICVPYRTDLVYGRSNSNYNVQNSLTTDVRVNKIFVNVWPTGLWEDFGTTWFMDWYGNYFNY